MHERTTISLQRFDADLPLFDVATDVYGRTWPEDDPAEIRDSFSAYARYPEFIGFIAFIDGVAAGVGYGARSHPGIWWHDEVTQRIGHDHPTLQDAWRLVELAVDPAFQGRGVGSRIHDALLAEQPCPRAIIATTVSNARARGMYERRGWAYISGPLHLPGKAEAHIVLAKEFQPERR